MKNEELRINKKDRKYLVVSEIFTTFALANVKRGA
jgi:hypothetical protein